MNGGEGCILPCEIRPARGHDPRAARGPVAGEMLPNGTEWVPNRVSTTLFDRRVPGAPPELSACCAALFPPVRVAGAPFSIESLKTES